MKNYRALVIYEKLLRGFQQKMTGPNGELERTLESGFGFLMKELHLTRVSLLWWEPERKSFSVKYAFEQDTLMESEEEIILEGDNPLWNLVREGQPVVVSPRKPWTAYVPLHLHGEIKGAVKFERKIPLPRAALLKSFPRINPGRASTREYPFLEDLADILSRRIQELTVGEEQSKKTRYLQAGTEVAHGVVETPRLWDMLTTVSSSIIRQLAMDRVRFYLVDSSKQELNGILGMQIPSRFLNLEEEKYVLIPHTNSLVDAVIEKNTDGYFRSAGGKVVTLPLQVGGQVIGCMAVDNLLSQQPVDEGQIDTLKALSVQIGMAVLNARLFEDIEQQAITDGLTKLYVYRYFQQRLKEETDRADRYSYSVALIMMDVDNFKQLNDTHGHPFGDKVLEFLAQHIRSNIRRIDLAARYGGDEFVLLLPEITEQEAWLMGARLLNTLRQSALQTAGGQTVDISVSLGVAMYPNDARTPRDLIEAADRALYWAKKNNRGDISFYRTVSGKVEKSA